MKATRWLRPKPSPSSTVAALLFQLAVYPSAGLIASGMATIS
jgi:hypothetical protein